MPGVVLSRVYAAAPAGFLPCSWPSEPARSTCPGSPPLAKRGFLVLAGFHPFPEPEARETSSPVRRIPNVARRR